ncbi:flavin reductase domain protein FMN-binding protein [Streptomyces laurentii]|uniref:Flavin reductase domain protein FMN-binding protein n=1 Tax=Streptomyces laurentii TaxID=39478 RepID=A0A160NV76_STRLU|nr:flavin reductase domain protein FMN-binding protein [Streptomyces laurentii]
MTVSSQLRTLPTAPEPRAAADDLPAPAGAGDVPGGPAAPWPGSPELLKAVFRRHAAGVAVVTAYGDGRPVGFTATSVNSVAAEPPLISFGAGTGSSSWPVLAEAEYIGVHILGEHQGELAATFARGGADRFAPPTRWHHGPEDVPVLDGVLAWLVCRVRAKIPAGDHRIVIAEAVAGDPAGAGRPLLYHRGRFNALRD